MNDPISIITVTLAAASLVFLFLLWRRPGSSHLETLAARFETLEKLQERTERAIYDGLTTSRKESSDNIQALRSEIALNLQSIHKTLHEQLLQLMERNDRKSEQLRSLVETKLNQIQTENTAKLEEMRKTVDEKLQGTLEQRLGESFKLVCDRLDQVHKGLGEMQSLATGVGDLKKVLVNVKTRGTWGEVQLGAMLEQILSPAQYETNVAVKEGKERVEFAIRLPGRGTNNEEIVWLPIDAKFPVEDYQRLLEAQEKADVAATEQAGKALENRIKECAATICEKYINVPRTTDFGILFLPTEGLFAEVIRRVGLSEYVQRECRVVIAGPTTLWSILNSLQMGFKTLAIEKRSSEVWKVLGAVKTEFARFGDLLEGVKRKLDQASNNIDDAARKSRTIERKLRTVQELPPADAQALLQMADAAPNGNTDGELDL